MFTAQPENMWSCPTNSPVLTTFHELSDILRPTKQQKLLAYQHCMPHAASDEPALKDSLSMWRICVTNFKTHTHNMCNKLLVHKLHWQKIFYACCGSQSKRVDQCWPRSKVEQPICPYQKLEPANYDHSSKHASEATEREPRHIVCANVKSVLTVGTFQNLTCR